MQTAIQMVGEYIGVIKPNILHALAQLTVHKLWDARVAKKFMAKIKSPERRNLVCGLANFHAHFWLFLQTQISELKRAGKT